MEESEELTTKKTINGIASMVMDLQPKLVASFDPNEGDKLIKSVNLMVHSMQLLEIPLLVTEQAPEKLGHTLPQVFDGLPNPMFFQKDTFSAFGSESFCQWVEDHEIEQLLLSGVETSICIYLTALDAISRNLGVTILSDCVASRRSDDGADALRELRDAGVHILGVETVLYSIMRSSSHPKFRGISKLVKAR
jgi:nicotinamidase-related amidase|tara:strand:+ start:1852 stop:2430 length:579 start_codon:yes stop_codon:yes gene_type:complete